MAPVLALMQYDVSLVLVLVCTSILKNSKGWLLSLCSCDTMFSCLSACLHLYSRKFKRIALVLALVRYDVSLVLTLVENSICTSRRKYLPSLSAIRTSVLKKSKEWLVS